MVKHVFLSGLIENIAFLSPEKTLIRSKELLINANVHALIIISHPSIRLSLCY